MLRELLGLKREVKTLPPAYDAAGSPVAHITQAQWDQLQADIKTLKSRQAALGDLSIDNENRLAKLDAKNEVSLQRFAAAIDQIDTRTQNLIASAAAVMARVDDLSALCRRLDKAMDDQQAAFSATRALSLALGNEIEDRVAQLEAAPQAQQQQHEIGELRELLTQRTHDMLDLIGISVRRLDEIDVRIEGNERAVGNFADLMAQTSIRLSEDIEEMRVAVGLAPRNPTEIVLGRVQEKPNGHAPDAPEAAAPPLTLTDVVAAAQAGEPVAGEASAAEAEAPLKED